MTGRGASNTEIAWRSDKALAEVMEPNSIGDYASGQGSALVGEPVGELEATTSGFRIRNGGASEDRKEPAGNQISLSALLRGTAFHDVGVLRGGVFLNGIGDFEIGKLFGDPALLLSDLE